LLKKVFQSKDISGLFLEEKIQRTN